MVWFISTLCLVPVILLLFKVWFKLTTGWCKSNVCLHGKTAIITGANTGIGYETAADFAKRGAKVILACRDKNRGQDAQQRLIKQTDNPNIFFKHLDLSSLKSVRQFAEYINKYEERLDILINNAGVVTYGTKTSEDGLQLMMQINYFGHFLLTNLLMDLIKKTPNSRIINVSSWSAKQAGHFDVEKLNESVSGGWKGMSVYGRSKLGNILFTIELAKRLRDTTVTTYSVHPGAVLTDVFRHVPPLMQHAIKIIWGSFVKNCQEGAQTTIYCSVEKEIEHLSGQHFHDCNVVKRYKSAQDVDLPSKLWQVSEELVNLNQK